MSTINSNILYSGLNPVTITHLDSSNSNAVGGKVDEWAKQTLPKPIAVMMHRFLCWLSPGLAANDLKNSLMHTFTSRRINLHDSHASPDDRFTAFKELGREIADYNKNSHENKINVTASVQMQDYLSLTISQGKQRFFQIDIPMKDNVTSDKDSIDRALSYLSCFSSIENMQTQRKPLELYFDIFIGDNKIADNLHYIEAKKFRAFDGELKLLSGEEIALGDSISALSNKDSLRGNITSFNSDKYYDDLNVKGFQETRRVVTGLTGIAYSQLVTDAQKIQAIDILNTPILGTKFKDWATPKPVASTYEKSSNEELYSQSKEKTTNELTGLLDRIDNLFSEVIGPVKFLLTNEE